MKICSNYLLAILTFICGSLKAATDPIADSIEGSFAFPYRLFIPDTATEENPLPLIVFLHGSGERGERHNFDNKAQVLNHIQPLIETTQGTEYPSFLLAPQAPIGWGNSGPLVMELIKHITAQYHIDPRRVYVTGLSNGGVGTWKTLAAGGNKIAAGVPLSSGGSSESIPAIATANTPVWVFHGGSDTDEPPSESQNMISLLKQAGQLPRYTERPSWGHNSWDRIYGDEPGWTDFYADGDPEDTTLQLYAWIFNQKSPLIIEPAPRPVTHGDRLLFDFGDTFITPSPDIDQRHWNHVPATQLSTGTEITNVRTDSGLQTTTKLITTTPFHSFNNAGIQNETFYPISAQRDSFRAGRGSNHTAALEHPGTLRIQGLPPNTTCRVSLFGSRAGNDGGKGYLTRYTINGAWQDLEAGNNTNDIIVFGPVSTQNDGSLEIEIAVSPLGTARYAHISTLEIEIEPQITLLESRLTNSTINFSFMSRRGWSYTLQKSDQLTAWNTVPGVNTIGNGSTKTFSWDIPPEPTTFYRVAESAP